jgi:hypothetical protein
MLYSFRITEINITSYQKDVNTYFYTRVYINVGVYVHTSVLKLFSGSGGGLFSFFKTDTLNTVDKG